MPGVRCACATFSAVRVADVDGARAQRHEVRVEIRHDLQHDLRELGARPIVGIRLQNDAIAAQPRLDAKRTGAEGRVLPRRADDLGVGERVLRQDAVGEVGLREEHADRRVPGRAQSDDDRVCVGRAQRDNAAIGLDRRGAIARVEDGSIREGDVGRREWGAVREARVGAQVVRDLHAVRGYVAVASRRNAGHEDRNVAIVGRETDEGLAKERVECDDVLVDRDERHERRGIAGVRDPQDVRRSARAARAARARREQRDQGRGGKIMKRTVDAPHRDVLFPFRLPSPRALIVTP